MGTWPFQGSAVPSSADFIAFLERLDSAYPEQACQIPKVALAKGTERERAA